MLLLGLVLGAAIGVVATWMVLHERVRTLRESQRADSEATGQLLRLADERHERDVARRDAAEEEREAELHRTLAPITATLSHLERSLARSEAARAEAEGALRSHIHQLAQRAESLESGTSALTAALRAPTSRGRWGEVQLRSIVEAAGMLEHVDFSEQHAGVRADGHKGQRPDLVVHLSGDRHVVVDAKAPMDAYLDAMSETDPQRAKDRRSAHAKALRQHVDQISAKGYWKALGDTPEFTVLFVPSDGVLAAALDTDPGLLEHAFAKDVIVASPATLMALLRTVAHTWRTDALNRDARMVLDAGRELHHRLGTMTGHLAKVGRSLDSSVAAFNESVGSLQSRVMVTARKFEDLGLTATQLDDVEQLTRRARTLEDSEIADLAAPSEGLTGGPDSEDHAG
ncbi:MAG TPA: DNA recombination protein RmuC [Candidatus Brachybacterium merdavium]|uniref:DNA recombination protein RmuC n=1 Tax=Candidatus Brachybacterium merdavium TaxID=2838513 RepID=A0A9D2RNP8_9MICO|nr:DNA recombination protein RmuC [Candidatus Brachybacterium merdavium]